MASELLYSLLRANLAGGAAILLILPLRPCLRRLLGPRAVYGLWLLAPLVALSSLAPFPRGGGWSALPIILTPTIAGPPHAAVLSGAIRDGLLLTLWALGAIVQASLLTLRQTRFMATLGELRPGLIGARRISRAARAGIGPTLVGSTIIVPADFEARFTTEEQEAILAHECAHLARGDMLANALAALAQCLCWFNPLVHLAVLKARIDQELACDAAVIEARPNLRRSYAEALLKTQLAPMTPPIGCTWPSRAQHPLKERISMLSLSPPTRLRRRTGVVLLVALSLGGGYTAWAAQPATHEIASPDWVQRPGGEDVARVYPSEAAKRHLDGSAVMACQVEAAGTLSACRIERQAPEGTGFGDASLKLATLFRMKPTARDGAPTANGVVRIPIKFAMQAAAPAR